jgi:hypothetical protein
MAGTGGKSVQVDERHPLKWPDGFGRTLIDEREDQRAWKKQMSVYIKAATKELELLGATTIVFTWNEAGLAQRDPGVAIWFGMTRKKDTSWQRILQIDNPNPDPAEVDRQFKRLSFKHHPDQVAGGSGGDVKMYMKLEEAWRNAKAWIQGESPDLQNCLPCDLYVEPRQNMAALKLTLSHLRALQRLGNPFIVESMMEKGLRTALPAGEPAHV